MTNFLSGNDEIIAWRDKQRSLNKKIAHCHGVFDILHEGHIEHLEQAKNLGDALIVTITDDEFVNKGPNRPYLSASKRMKVIGALGAVDAVSISKEETALGILAQIQPDFYVKGPDYKSLDEDITGNIRREMDTVESFGGQIVFTDGATNSSSSILNKVKNSKSNQEAPYSERILAENPNFDVASFFQEISKLKVLVVGEAILDTYVTCEALGKSSKDPVLAFRRKFENTYLGGSLAVANHAAGLGAKVTLLTRTGNEPSVQFQLDSNTHPELRVILQKSSVQPTITKTRFLDEVTGNKVFETYEMYDGATSEVDSRELNEKLEKEIPKHDVVIVADYGHGLFDQKSLRILERHKEKICVNTQSNAGNRGFNSIVKYKSPSLVCLNGSEVSLELRMRRLDLEALVTELAKRTESELTVVTSGSSGLQMAVASDTDGATSKHYPAFTSQVRDRVGAGDALFVALSLAYKSSKNASASALLGNLAGAAAVKAVGNSLTLDSVSLQRHFQSEMK